MYTGMFKPLIFEQNEQEHGSEFLGKSLEACSPNRPPHPLPPPNAYMHAHILRTRNNQQFLTNWCVRSESYPLDCSCEHLSSSCHLVYTRDFQRPLPILVDPVPYIGKIPTIAINIIACSTSLHNWSAYLISKRGLNNLIARLLCSSLAHLYNAKVPSSS